MKEYAWISIPMYCPNCGRLNYSYQDSEGKVRYECNKCEVKLIKIKKSRRHYTVEMYAQNGQVDLT